MQFRFDKIEKDDLRIVDGNLYLRHNNIWYLFARNIKGISTVTDYGECTFSVVDNSGFSHLFYTRPYFAGYTNIEIVMGKFRNAEYTWDYDILVKTSKNAEEAHEDVRNALTNLNGEYDNLLSVSTCAMKNDGFYGFPDIVETDDEEDEDERNGYY